jgi:hypothetical protein
MPEPSLSAVFETQALTAFGSLQQNQAEEDEVLEEVEVSGGA